MAVSGGSPNHLRSACRSVPSCCQSIPCQRSLTTCKAEPRPMPTTRAMLSGRACRVSPGTAFRFPRDQRSLDGRAIALVKLSLPPAPLAGLSAHLPVLYLGVTGLRQPLEDRKPFIHSAAPLSPRGNARIRRECFIKFLDCLCRFPAHWFSKPSHRRSVHVGEDKLVVGLSAEPLA